MSKKTDRRLSLKRETLRQIDGDQLRGVSGGGKGKTYYCAASYTCTASDTWTQDPFTKNCPVC